jgi:hypothetical protein
MFLLDFLEVHTSSSNEPPIDTNQLVQAETDTTIPTKTDGTADMRYTESKDAVAAGTIKPDEKLTGGEDTFSGESICYSNMNKSSIHFVEGSTSTDIPTTLDGTADMRFGVSQDAVASGEISRDEVLSDSNEGLIGETLESS